jgi:hypothetical protein
LEGGNAVRNTFFVDFGRRRMPPFAVGSTPIYLVADKGFDYWLHYSPRVDTSIPITSINRNVRTLDVKVLFSRSVMVLKENL